jgi:hypothetical protein
MLTYEEFYKEYPPSEELKMDCLYESIRLKLVGHIFYKSTDELIQKAMHEDYKAYCQFMKQKVLTEV